MTGQPTGWIRGAQSRAREVRHVYARVRALEAEVATLRDDIDEMRRDGRHVAELYDLVIEELAEARSQRSK